MMNTVDPATWPLWPLGTLVAIAPSKKNRQVGNIVAVGTLATRITTGHAGKLVLFQGSGIAVEIDGQDVLLVDEKDVLALVPERAGSL